MSGHDSASRYCFSDEEFAKIKEYVEKYGLSMFGLSKMSICEFLKKHPNGPPK